jgi:hypothetical protein
MRKLAVLALLVLFGGIAGAWATSEVPSEAQEIQDERVPLDSVPELVKKAALEAVPGISLHGVERETEDGVIVYEFAGVLESAHYEIEVDEKGKVIEVETEDDVEVSKLPEAVTRAALKSLPEGAELSWAEVAAWDTGFIYVIDAHLEERDWEVHVTADGTVITVKEIGASATATTAPEADAAPSQGDAAPAKPAPSAGK